MGVSTDRQGCSGDPTNRQVPSLTPIRDLGKCNQPDKLEGTCRTRCTTRGQWRHRHRGWRSLRSEVGKRAGTRRSWCTRTFRYAAAHCATCRCVFEL